MVGYHKHDTITTNEKLIIGCLSGVTTRFVTQPLDILKLRVQLQQKSKLKKPAQLGGTAKKILKEEGYKAFWHGHVLGQLHSILAVSSQFYVFELTTKYAIDLQFSKKHKQFERFLCGLTAGCVSATLVIPLEVIRVRQMIAKDQYGGLLRGAARVYRYGGIVAFYEGLSASVLQLGPQVGLSFMVFSYMQPQLLHFMESNICEPGQVCRPNRYKPQNILIASTIAGSFAGLISKTATYPLDLAKRRLQIGSHRTSTKYETPSTSQHLIKCQNLTDCLVKTVRKEGFLGLFQGWTVTIWKAQVTSVVAFTTYELLCYGTRELQGR